MLKFNNQFKKDQYLQKEKEKKDRLCKMFYLGINRAHLEIDK